MRVNKTDGLGHLSWAYQLSYSRYALFPNGVFQKLELGVIFQSLPVNVDPCGLGLFSSPLLFQIGPSLSARLYFYRGFVNKPNPNLDLKVFPLKLELTFVDVGKVWEKCIHSCPTVWLRFKNQKENGENLELSANYDRSQRMKRIFLA